MTLATRTRRQLEPGRPWPLGATLTPIGVNFAVYSESAHELYLLLFDVPDGEATDVIRLAGPTKHIWHVLIPGVRSGQLYGYQAVGEYYPAHGLRFNRHKLLLDPYARAVTHKFDNRQNLLLAYDPAAPDKDLVPDERANDRLVPKAIVVSDEFDWQDDRPPDHPLEELIVYETHLKGFTAHPSARVKRPGSYLGFVEKIPYLRELGINAVELLPIHEFYVDDFLRDRELTNYWGYNTVGFFAPESSYAAGKKPGAQVAEFKTLVRELHRAGIEVILDVVYNHTGEGNELGPTLSFKGLDNPTYYVLTGPEEAPGRHYLNYTGCGNSLNLTHPAVIRLVMDSLRYWVEVMHVDGFRFDLASVLGREQGGFLKGASFFDAIAQDPVLTRIKLIAEPWDIQTYQVGNFPVDWSEWNGKFRDTMRKFAKGDRGQLQDLGWRLTGSADLFSDDGRSAYNSVNFILCHDGFTLRDLVSYNQKHNEANGEDNRDGSNDNHAWNCGVEGETDDPGINQLRKQLAKNHLCHLFCSLGTPMLLGGDECWRTQGGNNNAYCQDNELSWFDWNLPARHGDLLDFTRKLIAFVKHYPIFRTRKVVPTHSRRADDRVMVAWFGPDGAAPAWDDPEARTLAFLLTGHGDQEGEVAYQLFFILNADHRHRSLALPLPAGERAWRRVVDTSLPAGADFAATGREARLEPAATYLANPRSTVILTAK